ncbi:MAG: protease SohB, partial [Bdellovibrionales bacterium]|nr:protease SohB [Bdellovibrionales bacterium]
MTAWVEIGVFCAKAGIILFAVLAVIIVVANLIFKMRGLKGEIEVEDLSKKIQDYEDYLNFHHQDPKFAKKEHKKKMKARKKELKEHHDKPVLYVVDFEGDIRATQVDNLREKVTAILTAVRPERDEVMVRVESPGGMVHTYGLAAAQLARFRERKIRLTISVDKVAASGGYMMACTGDEIIAAPFAIVGSIGVVAQVPNLNRLLKKHNVDYEEITAGQYKRTISLFGEITEKGREKFMEQIEDTHSLFKGFVSKFRPHIDLSKVATGEHWYAEEA